MLRIESDVCSTESADGPCFMICRACHAAGAANIAKGEKRTDGIASPG
jgi:hypothetical protein